ncbi:MAG: valine--tRNA ligase [Spirochaetota bacterium]
MELPRKYEPHNVEEKWYRFWEQNGFFHSGVDPERKPFTIVIPPPNVTGALHMGHGLNNTIQDILVRWKRMQGFNAEWIPGTDHAGIATQNVVEKKLAEQGKTRQQVGREKFTQMVWEWKKNYGGRIIDQLKRLGASCDWQRERFTLDRGLSDAVKEVFVRLYEEGLIYRGKYIINWCPRCQTALSDEEVEHTSERGYLYYTLYPFKDQEGGLVVATTRPETMLGDTAVAVNPEDKRYKEHVGKKLILPLVEREIPIIADSYVDTAFGTGAVKITPAHDPNDFDVGLRHHLEQINIFNEDATVNRNGIPECEGMDRYQCRETVVDHLKKKGLLVKQESHISEIGHCYRCHTVVEPYLSQQWFVRMGPLAGQAVQVVEDGKIKFHPGRWKKVYMNWMHHIRDWCISRQIWWGHRIPVYYCQECGEVFASREQPGECRRCSSTHLQQDPDVLDTWFSSQLWPFSTLGWPENTPELDYYYPTDILVTDPGILFFWVARMIMSGLKFMREVPFHDVYIHGVVMDALGRKMSKSLGNGIDPIEVVEKYGADALRFTIVNISPMGQNLLLSMDKFNTGARFANKIWNASRYILMNIKEISPDALDPVVDVDNLDTAEKWILTRYQETIKQMNNFLRKYRLSDASSCIYDFFWHEFCDWYIETSKVKLYSGDPELRARAAAILLLVLEGSMKLLHPVMPFITEEVWQLLPLKNRQKNSIMVAEYPRFEKNYVFPEIKEKMALLQEIVYNIRNIRGEMNVPPEMKARVVIKALNGTIHKVLMENDPQIRFLANLDKLTWSPEAQKPSKSASAVGTGYEVYLPLEGLIDLDKEKARLEKERRKLEDEIEKCRQRLQNPQFLNRAPSEVVEREKNRLSAHEESHRRIRYIMASLE